MKDDVPSVNQAGRDDGNAKSFKMLAIMLIGCLVVLVGIALTIGRYQQSKADEKAKQAEAKAQEQKNMVSGTKSVDIGADMQAMQTLPPPMGVEDMEDETVDIAQPTPEPIPEPAPAPMPVYDDYDDEPDEPAPAPIVQEKVEHSSVLVDVYGAKSATTQPAETGLAGSMRSPNLANGTVSNRGDTTMMLLKGTTIPCVLKTRIDSTYQGFTICQVAKDVYSANGKVLLIERGSSVFGEQNIQMSQGKARVAILWGKIETPKNISINLDSPATGQLGEMGVGAKVNNHFWKRFGGAIMLSVIQDAFAVGRSHLEKQNENGQTTINNTKNTAESMTEEILKNTINIPPTATVNQGTVINIMVARDVDFSGIYGLQAR